jgi:hypothetical protein
MPGAIAVDGMVESAMIRVRDQCAARCGILRFVMLQVATLSIILDRFKKQ